MAGGNFEHLYFAKLSGREGEVDLLESPEPYTSAILHLVSSLLDVSCWIVETELSLLGGGGGWGIPSEQLTKKNRGVQLVQIWVIITIKK